MCNAKSLEILLSITGKTTTRTPAFCGYPPPPHDYPHYWVMLLSQNKVEWLWRYRSRSKVATCDTYSPCSRAGDHLYKYGKTPSGTVDATERTRFSRPRPNDLEDISQGQRSLYATHPLRLEIICATYGKNPSRTVDFIFSRSRPNNLKKLLKIQISRFWKCNTRHTL